MMITKPRAMRYGLLLFGGHEPEMKSRVIEALFVCLKLA